MIDASKVVAQAAVTRSVWTVPIVGLVTIARE